MIKTPFETNFTSADARADAVVISWDHARVSFLTRITDGEVMLRITSKVPRWPLQETYTNDPADLVQTTAALSFADDIPQLEAILNQPEEGFNTAGGQPLQLELRAKTFLNKQSLIFYVQSIYSTFTITFTCRMVEPGTDPAADPPSIVGSSFDVPPALTTACAARLGKTEGELEDDDLCRATCIMPEGQGRTAGAFVRVFGDFRTPIYTSLFFAAPVIDRVVVTDTSLPGTAVVTYESDDFGTSGPIMVPTHSGRVRIEGRNFGRYPVLSLLGDAIGDSFFEWFSWGGYNAERSHTHLELDAPEGQGTMFPMELLIGDQSLEDGGLQFTPNASFKAPIVTSFDQNPPTNGGVWLNFTGANFGSFIDAESLGGRGSPFGMPEFQIAMGRSDSIGFVPCEKTMRTNHTHMSCLVPEGSGGDLEIQVYVAG